jgi:ABC-type transport system involved in cytochrome c biogenesis permease subunit
MSVAQSDNSTARAGKLVRSSFAANPAYAILRALGSLKITTTMFALAIVIVLIGTLAQDEMDLADVKREFFTCWIASVPLDVFLPVTLFPHAEPYFGGLGFYFPGGATIGLVLLVNLIAAKVTRFKVNARGWKLMGGILLSLLGTGLITAVIVSGHAADGLQGKPPMSYESLWGLLKGGMVVLSLALVGYALIAKLPAMAKTFTWLAAGLSVGLSVLLLVGGEAVRLDDPGLRIVWQLLQATIASSVALAGLALIFGKRGGNVLIHAGVGLLMVGQFVFGDRQIEQRIGLAEGASTNMAVIEDEIEIALVDISQPDEDLVYAIPEQWIRRAERTGEVISDPDMPVKVRIVNWMRNSKLAVPDGKRENPATAGFGLRAIAIEEKPLGAAIMNDRNIAAAYVELLDKQTDESLGVFLLSQQQNDMAQLSVSMRPDVYEQVTIDGRPFEMAIRYRQERKPYDVLLKDVERINYSGTDTPRDYSSRIVITDRASGESMEGKTWMNNPIRYKGETFYQSRYNKIPLDDTRMIETTGLQVVENMGWVIPYVACMMVFVGMFAHFGGTFTLFANRYSRGAIPKVDAGNGKPQMSWWTRLAIAGAALGLCAVVAGYYAKPKKYGRTEINWNAIGSLPVQHEGRIKPFDSVARNVLQKISKPIFGSVPYVEDASGDKRLPSEWLMGVMAQQDWVREANVFRIYAPEVRDFFDLEKRKGYRYSLTELEPKLPAFREEIDKLRNKTADEFDFREKKFAEMQSQLNTFDLLTYSYQMPPLPELGEDDTDEMRRRKTDQIMRVFEMMQKLESGGPPSIIPPHGEATEENLVDAKWQAYGPAVFTAYIGRQLGILKGPVNPAIFKFSEVLDAIRSAPSAEVNAKVREYEKLLAENPLASTKMSKASAESWLNQFNPTAQGVALYLLAIIVSFASFLVRHDGLRRGAFWLLVGIFIIHTIALVSRIYISGRAPVINLYSSAVFIGWACVLLSLFLERIYPIGVANLVAAFIGVGTLSVARLLDTSDTLPVLQAVLDTQFWLSTHVITVTAGYAVTFLAGFIGIVALVHRMATRYDAYKPGERPAELESFQQILYRMTYGVICFAIFFSFIGTVLGGLWADDSWGRFWGWDPKENGALMIVLWNALMLHARWDKQVGPRGFALLAVVGNVITAWSWFGTNQLGIGLHSYGFTSGTLIGLGLFFGFNMLFVGIAYYLTRSPREIRPATGE